MPYYLLLKTSHLSQPQKATIATFADDIAMLIIEESLEKATENLKQISNNISTETKKWEIELNEQKSA